MGFSFGKMGKMFLGNLAKAAKEITAGSAENKQPQTPAKDDFDFWLDHEEKIDFYQDKVDCLKDIPGDWNGESDPNLLLKKYDKVIDFLHNSAAPYFQKHSEKYGKDILKIYDDLLKQANEEKADFIKNNLPGFVAEYNDFLEYKKECKQTKNLIIKKLRNCDDVKQAAFIKEFDDADFAKEIIDDLVEQGIVCRKKKSGAYYIGLTK